MKSSWTAEDDEAIKKYYPDGGPDEVAKYLSVHRYPHQITNRASMLGVKRNPNFRVGKKGFNKVPNGSNQIRH